MKMHPGIGLSLLPLLVTALVWSREALAVGKLGGRVFLAYQKVDGPRQRAEYFSQNVETLVKDKLFEKNDLTLAFYFDNYQNLSSRLTTRRYYGRFDLSGQYYRINVQYTPRQRISPLETSTSREEAERQYVVELLAPRLPQFRVYYAKKRKYLEGAFQGYNRDFRLDMSYHYRFVSLELNRWRQKATNTVSTLSTVTGGRLRARRTILPGISLNSSYEYRLTETERTLGPPRRVSNHTLSLLSTARYRKYLSSSLSYTTRRLHSRDGTGSRGGRNDSFSLQMSLLPKGTARFDLARTYLLNDQDTLRNLSDYLTVQVVFTWRGQRSSQARLQLARRLVLASTRGAIPSNLAFLSLRSRLYRGVEARSDLSISQRPRAAAPKDRYQISSVLELFLAPRRNTKITLNFQHFKYSECFSFFHNDRASYGMTFNYFLNRSFHLGIDARRSLVTSGKQEDNGSLSFTVGTVLTSHLSVNAAYAFNRYNKEVGEGSDRRWEKSYRRNFNLDGQWNLGVGKWLSFSYARLEQVENVPNKYLTLNYNQSF